VCVQSTLLARSCCEQSYRVVFCVMRPVVHLVMRPVRVSSSPLGTALGNLRSYVQSL